MFAGKKSAQIREILISESTREEMTCLFAPSLDIALIKQRMLANIETSNPYHAQYILRRRDDYLVLFDRDALSCRFFYDAFPGMRLRHQVTGDTDDDRLAHSPADRMYTGKDHQKYTFCTK
ncbi:hypothetical protein ECZC10_26600 [Escherichia coli]|nr:hypothetical protein ECZC03_27560 [Escherichia coli]GJH94812.1 hypothetical protein ECZC10_26600 [Escherichia coli]